MTYLLAFFERIVDLFNIPMTIYGWTFSFWDLFLFSLFGGIIAAFIGRLLNYFG